MAKKVSTGGSAPCSRCGYRKCYSSEQGESRCLVCLAGAEHAELPELEAEVELEFD